MPISLLKGLTITLKLSLAIFLFLSLERLTHLATDGFSVIRMTHPLPKMDPLSQEEFSDDFNQIKAILSQPFHYLNSGAQSYVFESADKRYVLKFFKFHHLRPPAILNNFLAKTFLKSYREKKIYKKQKQLEKAFASHEIAYHHLKDMTNLTYLHLKQTNHIGQIIHLIDRIGIHYQLPLDQLAFALQRKGSLVYPTLNQLVKKRGQVEAVKAIQGLLSLIRYRCKQGIADLDPDFSTNFAFLDGKPFQIDLGRFEYNSKLRSDQETQNELIRSTSHFKTWLSKHHPELIFDYNLSLSSD